MTAAEHNERTRAADRPTMPKVLIVDDSATIRRILGRALAEDGYRIEEAGDGREAIERCRAEAPDLVLLDIDMPVLDGLSALRAMKDDEELRTIHVLFLTAHTAGEDVAAGLALGAQDYLRKPCDPVELRARVSTALRIKAQEDRLEREIQASREISTTDPLTGLGNRRRLEAKTEELTQGRGARVPVGVLMIDADHFKRVNDEEGHAVGDVVLRIIAGRLGGAIGGDDTVVRWGGEEFVVLTPGATDVDVERLGERLRAGVGDSPFAISHTLTLKVTVSVGCAVGALEDIDALLEAADEALYDAKSNGRNCVAFRSHRTSDASA
jgi:two-component system cell cycle response regulator